MNLICWDRRGGEAYYYLALAGLPRTVPTDEVVPERGVAKAYQSKCEIRGKMFLLRVIVDDSVAPPVVVTAYRTTKIEKYWGKP